MESMQSAQCDDDDDDDLDKNVMSVAYYDNWQRTKWMQVDLSKQLSTNYITWPSRGNKKDVTPIGNID